MAFQHFRILLIAALILASILPLAIGSKAALAVDVITDVEENSPPVVKNVTARQEPGTAMVEITYDVSDEHHTAVTISLDFWDGSAWQHCESVTPEGKIPVVEGCQVYWDAGADFPEHYVTDCRIEVTADDEYTWYGEPFNNLSSTAWPEPYTSEPFSPEFILDTRTEITPPVISAVIASDITQTSAIVRWNTDEPATSQVAYSTTSHPGDYPGGATIADVLADYGSWSAENATRVMVHAVPLSGLELDTTYYYRVLSRDASGNEAWSDEHWFKTKVDETPPMISGVEAPEADITETSAIIRWNTDEPATSQVAYSPTSHAGAYASIAEVLAAYGSWSAEDPTLVMVHAVALSGLDPGTEYFYRVLSKDVYDNEAWSDEYQFETEADETPPVISAVVASDITETGAIIRWNTNEPATAQVEYGAAEAGLVLDLPMDEGAGSTAGDLSGYGNDGTIYGPTWIEGISGNALSFDGSDDYVILADDLSLNITDEITIEAWVKPNQTASWGTVVDKRTPNYSNINYALYTSDRVRFEYVNPENTIWHMFDSPSGSAASGVWQHIAFTLEYGNGSSAKVYVDGALQSGTWISGDGSTPVATQPFSVLIGRASTGTGHTYFDGLIDEVRIYNRALSAEEVLEHYLYASYGSTTPLDPTLVFHHVVALGGLDPDATYHYRVRSMDAADNEAISDDYTFTTLPDEIAPTISGVTADNITDSGAIISWDTNEPATAQVEYGAAEDGLVLDLPMDEGAGPTAGDLSGYGNDGTLYPAPTELSTCDATTDWTGTSLSTETTIKVEGTGSVKDTIAAPNAGQWYITSFNPAGVLDLSGKKHLILWFRCDRPSTAFTHHYVGVYDTLGNYKLWNMDFAADTWGKHKVLLSSAGDSHSETPPDLSDIDYIVVTFFTADTTPFVKYIDYLIADDRPVFVDGVFGKALEFDGKDDYVDCGNDASLVFTTQFTVEALIRPSDLSDYRRIVSKFESPSLCWIVTTNPDGKLDLQVRPGPATRRGVTSISTTEWTHIAAVYDGPASRLDVYINGVLDNATLDGMIPAALNTDASKLLIGSAVTSPYPMLGEIDEVRIYNRALSAEEVLEHYLDASYGSTTPLKPALVFHHGVALGGLDPVTTYHYRVRSMDAAGMEAISDDYTFTTLPDTTPPTISGVTADDITSSSAVICWNTNEPATTQVEYGGTTDYGSMSVLKPNLTYSHSVLLVDLNPDTTYHYRVKSVDAAGMEAISEDYTFTTELDTTAPQISDVITTNVGETSAIVQWLTDEPATSQVAYGTTSHAGDTYADIAGVLAAYESSTTEDTALVTNHGVPLSGLSSGVTIYYRVLSKDGDGNEAWSAEYSFETTDTTPPALVWIDTVLITDTGAVIAWETDEDAYCQIVYSTTSHPGDYSSGDDARAAYEFSEPEETTPLLGHQAVIDGFTSGTTIYYRIISRDEAANEAVSAEYSFTTT